MANNQGDPQEEAIIGRNDEQPAPERQPPDETPQAERAPVDVDGNLEAERVQTGDAT